MNTKRTFLYFIFLFSAFIALKCKNTHQPASKKAMYKAIYIDQFKLTYFRQVLIKSYNNSTAIQEIINTDHSGFAEPIPILTEADYRLIDSLTAMDNENLKIDSVQGSRRAEGAQGKRPLGYILERLNNKWLDSLANKRYKSAGFKAPY